MIAASPLISVIIPVYNREKYIADAVESVIRQTYPHWELIIVDDGSTDGTLDIIRSYQQDYPIRLLQTRKEASGPSHARNCGIDSAAGEWITFLDSDDVYYPDALELLIKGTSEHPNKQVIQGFYSSVDEHLSPIRTQGIDLIPQTHGGYTLPYGTQITWLTFLKGQFFCSLTTSLFHQSIFKSVGLLREDLTHWEDYEFFVRIFKHHPEAIIPMPIYIVKYRHQTQSTSRSIASLDKMIGCYLAVLDDIFTEPTLPHEARQLKSFVYTRIFKVLARIQLNQGHGAQTRHILSKAYFHPNIPRRYWLRYCIGPFCQSFLPQDAYHTLANLNRCISLRLRATLIPTNNPTA